MKAALKRERDVKNFDSGTGENERFQKGRMAEKLRKGSNRSLVLFVKMRLTQHARGNRVRGAWDTQKWPTKGESDTAPRP